MVRYLFALHRCHIAARAAAALHSCTGQTSRVRQSQTWLMMMMMIDDDFINTEFHNKKSRLPGRVSESVNFFKFWTDFQFCLLLVAVWQDLALHSAYVYRLYWFEADFPCCAKHSGLSIHGRTDQARMFATSLINMIKCAKNFFFPWRNSFVITCCRGTLRPDADEACGCDDINDAKRKEMLKIYPHPQDTDNEQRWSIFTQVTKCHKEAHTHALPPALPLAHRAKPSRPPTCHEVWVFFWFLISASSHLP